MELFASFHAMLTKHIDTDITDIVSTIFEYYDGTYESYTLLELIDKMYTIKYKGDFVWNKKAIIQKIKDEGLPIPPKDLNEPFEYNVWEHYRVRRSLDLVYVKKYDFHVQDGDIIKMIDQKLYKVDCIVRDQVYDSDADTWVDIILMYFSDMQTNEERCITADEFFEILDEEDVTIMQNLNAGLYIDEEQRAYYTGPMGQRWI